MKPGNFFSSPFGSAILGGLVVAIAGLGAIEAGWIGDDDGDASTIGAPALTRPVSDGGGEKGLTVGDIYERDSDGVAFIQAGQASGSGFVIDDQGHVITNAHVVEGASEIEVKIGDDEQARSAELVGADPSSDVALLKVGDAEGLSPLQLGDSSKVEVGDPVVAIGNPFGLDRTVTSGIVSAKQRQIQAPNGFSISDVIQTDAAVNPGNSGGPLFDGAGRVIGINSQIASGSGGNDGVAFAVPIATAQDVVDQLLENGEVSRAYLGITGAQLTPEAAAALELGVESGVLVESVVQGGPAEEAGIKGATGQLSVGGQTVPSGGDVITKLEGEPVADMEEVISAVNEAKPGDPLTLTVLGDGSEREVTVTLAERPAQIEDASSAPAPSAP